MRKIQVYCSNKDYGCKKQLQWRHLEVSANFVCIMMPALVAQLDMHLIGDQEVTVSIQSGSGNILSWRLVMK